MLCSFSTLRPTASCIATYLTIYYSPISPNIFSNIFHYSSHISPACVIQWHPPDLTLRLSVNFPPFLPPHTTLFQCHLPDLTLRLPALSWHFLITFPHHFPRQFSSIPHPTQRHSMTPPRPFPDFTLWFPVTFPIISSSPSPIIPRQFSSIPHPP